MKKTRIISTIVCLTLMLSVVMPTASVSMATTVPAVSPEAIYLNTHGIMLGSGGDLRLGDDFTVEQLLTILARLAGKEAEAKAYPVANNFKDVPATRWSAPYTAWAKATGVSMGKPDGSIGYAEKVTAQRLAAFLLRTMGYADVPYADVIKRAAALGFMQASQPAGTPLLRGTVAKMVHDAMQASTQSGSTLAVALGLDAAQLSVTFKGTYVSGNNYRIDLDKATLPTDMPRDVMLGYGGIMSGYPVASLTAAQMDTDIYHMNNLGRGTFNDMNGDNGGVYPISVVMLYSPSADKGWYHLFTQKMAEGTIRCTLRMIDFSARNKAEETAKAAYDAMRDDGHAASIDANGNLVFDASKWKVKPARFVGLSSGTKGVVPLYDNVMPWLPMYLKTAISAGEPFRSLGGSKASFLSERDWIYYVSADNKIVGYTSVTAQDVANYYGSFSIPAGIVKEQGAIFGYPTDGTQPGLPDSNAYALYTVPDKAMKYAYVSAGDYDELHDVAYIATMEQNQLMPTSATPITEAVPYYLSRGTLPEGRGLIARFFDSNKKLVAIETLTRKQLDEAPVDVVTAKLPTSDGLFSGLDQMGLSRELIARNIKVRVALDGKDVGTVPLNLVTWVGISLYGGSQSFFINGQMKVEPPYVLISGLYGYGGRLRYTLIMPNGDAHLLAQ